MENFNLTDLRLFLSGLLVLSTASDELDAKHSRLLPLIEDLKKRIEQEELKHIK